MQRHASLDILRGIAILGILVMNIQSFAMPWTAYAHPHAFGSLEGIHGWTWLLSHIFADTKFFSLFALLFGAGIALMADRLEERGVNATTVHYRRMVVLGLIGLAHGFLIWTGDILFMYAVCGLVVYLLHRMRPLPLLITGAGFLAIPVFIALIFSWTVPHWPDQAIQQMQALWEPGSKMAQQDLATYSAGWLEQLPLRADRFLTAITWGLAAEVFWHAGGLMLIGMALYRLGIVTAQRSDRFYVMLMIPAFLAGFALIFWGLAEIEAREWAFPWTKIVGRQFNNIGAPLVAIGYLCLIMLACRHATMRRRLGPLAAVGRTALSNYLLQSLICTFVFYGHGLGLFGQIERGGQMLVVVAVWMIQIPLSVWWLRHFHQGPVEWLWRAASRGEWPAFRRPRPGASGPGPG